jgi:hypothetical protein
VTNLVELAARLLDREDRETMLGDLEEAGESSWRRLLDISGLVVRRQAMLWQSWRPWLAAFGLAFPVSLLLMGFSLTITQSFRHLGAPGHPANGFAIPVLLSQVGLLVGWSWIGGFVLASISRRTLWVSMVLCACPCLFCLARFRVPHLPSPCLLLFLLPAIWGVRRNFRAPVMQSRTAAGLALAVTLLTIFLSNGGLPNWILTWPAWYLAATAETSRV